jgi:cytosine deaminase
MLNSNRYWLKNAHIPSCLITSATFTPQTRDGLCLCDLYINQGVIEQIILADNHTIGVDLKKGIVLPCFVDLHTHLDKGFMWERSPNLDGTFETALNTVKLDTQYWSEDDLYRRMEFGLKCSYTHGTSAIRTHLDCFDPQAHITLKVWQDLRQKWQNQITLQAVSLVSLDYFLTPSGIRLADQIAEIGGILGGVAYMNPEIDSQLDRIFILAKERGLDLDFHVDENGEPDSICLHKVAETAIKHQFQGRIVCGHCCSLAVQPLAQATKTIKLVKEAGIAIVSLPMCNLFLQDRQPEKTPFWRGITRVHELKQAGISVSFASDNCRDPFFCFGDLDVLEVFNQSVRIAHLDTPYDDWISSVTKTPAEIMRLSSFGRIGVGLSADLVIFKARFFSELLSRNQRDRLVLRKGKSIDTTLPDYSELDDLIFRY